ncbi:MAG: PTS sugar transporter subunit IIA [Ethanoligenens sp.]|uniref:PTS sugar transporter subunit IIA n=1 Tax=Ethanoligenens sp. TaxID=2099655 RepID=UPI0039E8DB94
MRYIILVSHGEFASGLKNATSMLIGSQKNLLCTGMLDGMGADSFVENFRSLIKAITQEDQIVLLADLAEGSPMTNALNTLSECGLMGNVIAIAGMNLPMVVTAAMLDEDLLDKEAVAQAILEEAHNQLRTMQLDIGEDDEI